MKYNLSAGHSYAELGEEHWVHIRHERKSFAVWDSYQDTREGCKRKHLLCSPGFIHLCPLENLHSMGSLSVLPLWMAGRGATDPGFAFGGAPAQQTLGE